MLEMKNDFECTDDDCMQCCKSLGNRKYLFIQAFRLDGEDIYSVISDIEDLTTMSLGDIENAILKDVRIVIGNIKVKLLHGTERKKLFRNLLIRTEKCF